MFEALLIDRRAGDPIDRVVSIGLGVAGVVGLVAAILLVTIHQGDAFRVDHASGVWMALAAHLRAGELYPPLFDGVHFGGARYMPAPIFLYALSAASFGESVTSLKIVNLAAAVTLTGVLFATLRARGSSRPLALSLCVGVFTTEAGLMVATGRSDAIPAVLQLGALGLLAVRPSRPKTIAAALLCVMAVLSKVTAIYAPIAIGIWLAGTDRPAFVRFVGVFLGGLALSLGLLHVWTDGRMAANFLEVSASGINLGSTLRAPIQLLEQMQAGLQATVVLLPFVLLAVISSVVQRAVTVIQVSLLVAALVLLVVMTDTGAAYNHHLEVAVLVALVIGDLWVSARGARELRLAGAIGLAVILGSGVGILFNVLPDLQRGALEVAAGERALDNDPDPLATLIRPTDVILSEDPTVPVTLGSAPIILDPVMLLRFQRNHPDWTAQLVARIDRGEFKFIVLLRDVGSSEADAWYRDWHLGTQVHAAVKRSYDLIGRIGRYYLYEFRGGGF